ncbi:MAG: YncE family protein [Actinomycetota bacterium]
MNISSGLRRISWRGTSLALLVVITTVALPGLSATAGPGTISQIPLAGYSCGLAIDPTRNLAYTLTGCYGALDIIDLSQGKVVHTIFLPEPDAWAVDVNPVTNRIYVATSPGGAGYQGRLMVVDGNSRQVIANIPVGDGVVSVAVNSVTNRIYVSNANSAYVSVIDGATNTEIAQIRPYPHGTVNYPYDFAVDQDSNLIYVSLAYPVAVAVVDGATNQLLGTIPTPPGPDPYLALDNSTHRLFVIHSGSNNMQVIDTNTRTVIADFKVGANPLDVVVSPLTHRVYVSRLGSSVFGQGYLLTIDQTTNSIIDTSRSIGSVPWYLAAAPTGYRLYAADAWGSSLSVISEDVVAPVSTISTPNASIRSPGQTISGSVTEDFSGVAKEQITFTGALGAATQTATLTCTPNRLSCTWQVPAPTTPGAYLVQVQGVDNAGSTETAGPSTSDPKAGPYIAITVV